MFPPQACSFLSILGRILIFSLLHLLRDFKAAIIHLYHLIVLVCM
uniref:Uncharacterized protein n=1 Tax=Arundo donax TaxID=35708 RepID=A0A0A9CMM3_ARUDO